MRGGTGDGSASPEISGAAAEVLRRCAAAPARLPGPEGPGSGRLLCLDGPAGSGKTSLAAAVASAAAPASVSVLHLDDLYEGWSGLADVGQRLREDVVAPLATVGRGHYRRWDWHADGWAERRSVEPADLLVVEGVGAGTPELDPWRSLLVWLDAPAAERKRRALARDGAAFAPHWDSWAADEAALHARERTAQRADLRL